MINCTAVPWYQTSALLSIIFLDSLFPYPSTTTANPEKSHLPPSRTQKWDYKIHAYPLRPISDSTQMVAWWLSCSRTDAVIKRASVLLTRASVLLWDNLESTPVGWIGPIISFSTEPRASSSISRPADRILCQWASSCSRSSRCPRFGWSWDVKSR